MSIIDNRQKDMWNTVKWSLQNMPKNKNKIKKATIHVRFFMVIFCASRVYFALFRPEPFIQSLCTCVGNECPAGQSTGERSVQCRWVHVPVSPRSSPPFQSINNSFLPGLDPRPNNKSLVTSNGQLIHPAAAAIAIELLETGHSSRSSAQWLYHMVKQEL